jgi:hypothetical protein
MPTEISPRQVQQAVQRGFKRFANFRSARLMFIRNYVGQYYDADRGAIGGEALNLTFNAIRTLIPNIVMQFPVHKVNSRYLAYREYAELLGLALSQHDKQSNIRDVYRRVIVDSLFALGILKTGLAESDSIYTFDEGVPVDPGTIYTEAVDFDNFVVDPTSREHMFRDAAFMGDRILIPRGKLLDSGLYDNALVERLPRAGTNRADKKASSVSMHEIDQQDDMDMQDMVEVAELWVPGANCIVTVPGTDEVTFDEYLRIDDYYGPDTGPYTLLSLTPPVPGNPLPVPVVGVWNDLHILANRMAKKIIDQAERQKDIVGYKRGAADDAQSALDASDGEAIAVDDPDGVKVYSFGGQQQSNEVHLQYLTTWFNQMAANPEAVGGQRIDASSATEARILAGNANIGLEDMRDAVYQMAASEARKRAWYLHTDPLISLPLIKRQYAPAQYQLTNTGIVMSSPSQVQDVQVMLTPEARCGDFLDFAFEIEPESMGRKDGQTRLNQAIDFAVKILPAATTAAQAMAMLGVPFNVKEYILRMAKDAGIDWMDQVFYDPEFQMRMAMQMMAGPQMDASKGQLGMPNAGLAGAGGNMAAMLQNGQPGNVMEGAPSATTAQHREEQAGANPGQQQLRQGFGA